MESEDTRQLGVHIVSNDDLEAFALELSEAVAQWSVQGPPAISFSHTATEDGFNYVAIVTGYGDANSKVTVTRRTEPSE